MNVESNIDENEETKSDENNTKFFDPFELDVDDQNNDEDNSE
jgi:hypothetical protein